MADLGHGNGPLTLRAAYASDDLAAVRALCWGYRDFLLQNSAIDREITQAFYPVPKYRALMEDLAELHARPQGVILLALLGNTAVGCGMTHALDGQTAEIKRVYVTDAARGKGLATKICTALVDQARSDGFSRVVLDTSKTLTAAQALYSNLGFAPCGPYQPIPEAVLPHLRFFELNLRESLAP